MRRLPVRAPIRVRATLTARATAAAHQQLGQAAAALHHAGLARAWGCSKQRLARWLLAPQELPVGVLTAALGGTYLLWLMHRRTAQGGVL